MNVIHHIKILTFSLSFLCPSPDGMHKCAHLYTLSKNVYQKRKLHNYLIRLKKSIWWSLIIIYEQQKTTFKQ